MLLFFAFGKESFSSFVVLAEPAKEESFMRKFLCFLLILLLFVPALASEPATPADPAMIAALLPAYTLVEGIDDRDELRLLMRNTEDELVFVGGVRDEKGLWHFTESTPLPKGTILGVENFTHSLGLPSPTYYDSVSVQPYADGTWGVSFVYPQKGGMTFLGQHVIYDGIHEVDGFFGRHPWSDIAGIDWTSLPDSFEEALAHLDRSNWAVVSNPNPADRLHLRAAPDKDAASYGKYYNRTPVFVREYGREWCAVTVCGLDGYMMTRFLAFQEEMDKVDSAGPMLSYKENLPEHRLYASPSSRSPYVECENHDFYILGVAGDSYHVWLPRTEEYGYIRMDDLWPGNG